MSFELNTGERAAAVWTGRGDRPPGAEWVIPGWLEYVEMARQREYVAESEARDAHSFLLSLGVEEVPHSSAADDLSTVGSPAELLALGNFWEHLVRPSLVSGLSPSWPRSTFGADGSSCVHLRSTGTRW